MDDILAFFLKNWALAALFLVILVITIAYELWMNSRKEEHALNPFEAIAKINRENALVIDLRNKEAYLRGHIINALNLPLAQLATQLKRLEEHRHRPAILVCAQGLDSLKAKAILNQAQLFQEIKVLSRGMAAWQEAKLPLEKNS